MSENECTCSLGLCNLHPQNNFKLALKAWIRNAELISNLSSEREVGK